MSNRLNWVDAARGLGIVLVVYGHVCVGLIASGTVSAWTPWLSDSSGFIYCFHMALFFILAGMFARRGISKPASEFWTDKFATIVYPYFLWSLLQFAILMAVSGETNTQFAAHDLLRIFDNPIMHFWFLYCLFLGFCVYRLIYSLTRSAAAFFCITVLLSAAMIPFEFERLSVPGRARDNLPYFALGVALSPRLFQWASLHTLLLFGLVAAGFGITAIVCRIGVEINWVFMMLVPLPGTIAMLALSVLLTRWAAMAPLRMLGRYSLEIYVAHVIAYAGTRIGLNRVFGVTSVPVHLVAGTLVGIFAPLILARSCEKLGFNIFRWKRTPPAAPSTSADHPSAAIDPTSEHAVPAAR